MLRLHTNVYAWPPAAQSGPTVTLRSAEFATHGGLAGGPPLFTTPLPVAFEAMQAALLALPRSDAEPDGFFLVTGGSGDTFWRLNGHMHEFDSEGGGDAMHRVELNGECPADALDAVLRTMGWPSTELAFELVQEGVTLREPDFRRYAESPPEG
ncbi:hypothetical protein Mal64_22610 [Pseudobythopirellula maris]|uniref:Uncharacterized protein n=1 Tax=Pseudobythopirellula maris TaxID=2527991 RepID=A0A5C5ZR39_9BACT|nr:hypothetical protein [Pseudobythopirellula maris]TWT88773.1 hypothetical protein Mal64_22610 [Pseudobythopirellula maris]